jgi:hypothetical protein
LKSRYLSEDEARLAMQMVDDRNLTTHGYDEKLVEEICKQIPEYYRLMELVLQKTRINADLKTILDKKD